MTGAAGFVGTHTCRTLARAGWRVRALVRHPDAAAARLADTAAEIRAGDVRDADFLRAAMQGGGSVVHLAAIAIEHDGARYEDVNAAATARVLEAARAAGIDRIVHMSQNGSDARSPSRFLRSKGVAQDLVTTSELRWTVLRPSVIVGPEDAFVNVLARLVRLTPGILPLPGGGRARFQPILVGDVATAIAHALDRSATVGQILPLGGPVPLSLRDMAERILLAMHARRRIVGVPVSIVRPLVALAARALPNPPVTPELLDLLALDNTVPDNAIRSVLGIEPTPFAPEELLYLRQITPAGALRSLFRRR